jgi:hypothetical protein
VSLLREGKIGRIHRIAAWNYGNTSPFGIGRHPDGPPPADLDCEFWPGPVPKLPFNPGRFIGSFRWFWDYAGGMMTDRGRPPSRHHQPGARERRAERGDRDGPTPQRR